MKYEVHPTRCLPKDISETAIALKNLWAYLKNSAFSVDFGQPL